MSATVAELLAVVRADTRQFSTAMAAAKGETAGLTNSTRDFSKVGVAGLALVGLAAAKAVGDFVKFQTTMVRTVTLAGSTEQQMKDLSTQILSVAGELGQSPQELAEALYFTESAGIAVSNAMDVVTVSAKASAIGLGETQDVADALTSVLNAYGEENISAAHAADILTAAVKDGKGEADAIAGAIGRVIPIASEMGVEFEQVAGGIAALTQTGLDANEAVTALRGILTGLLNPTTAASEALDSVGLTVDGLRASIADRGLLPTLQDMKARFGDNVAAMGQVFGNVRALAGAMSLLGHNGDDVSAVFADVANSSGSVDEAFATVSQTAEFKLASAGAKVSAEFIKIGGAIAPLVTGFAGLLGAVAPAIPAVLALVAAISLMTLTTKIAAGTQTLIAALVTVRNAAYAAAISFEATGSASAAASAGMNALSPAAAKAAASLGSVALVVGATVGLWKLVSGVIGDAKMNMDQLSESSKVNADLLGYWKDQMDLSGSGFEAGLSLNGFWSSLDGSSDSMEDLNSRMGPLVSGLKDIGLSGRDVTAVLAGYQGTLEGTDESISAFTDFVGQASDRLNVWTQDLASGQISLDHYTLLVERLGLSHKAALALADAALDEYGQHVDHAGRVVQQFAGMTSKELDKLATDFAGAMGDMRKQSDLTAGNFKHDTASMLRVQLQFNADMRKLAGDSMQWVPDDYMAFLLTQGPGAIHDFIREDRSGQNQMVEQWKRTQGVMQNSLGIFDKLTDRANGLDGRHIRMTVTTDFVRNIVTVKEGRMGGRTPDEHHSGGWIRRHSGGAVKRMHSGGLAFGDVPIIAQTGEFMLRRSAARALGPETLHALNSVGGPRSVGSDRPVRQHPRGGPTSTRERSIMVRLDRRHYDEETLYEEDYGRGF